MTVSEIVSVLFTAFAPDPELAVTTTGNVPAGDPPVSGGGAVPPSPPPQDVITTSEAIPATTGRIHRVRARVASLVSMLPSSNPAIASASVAPQGDDISPAARGAVVVMVNVVVMAAPLGVSDAGAKAQLDSAGRPEQEKVTAWLKPPDGVTVSVEVTELPATTLGEVDEALVRLNDAAGAMVSGVHGPLMAASQNLATKGRVSPSGVVE